MDSASFLRPVPAVTANMSLRATMDSASFLRPVPAYETARIRKSMAVYHVFHTATFEYLTRATVVANVVQQSLQTLSNDCRKHYSTITANTIQLLPQTSS